MEKLENKDKLKKVAIIDGSKVTAGDIQTIGKHDPVFSIEFQYKAYLEQVGLSEDRMKPFQKIETKRAFMAGFGKSLVVMRNDISMLPTNDDQIDVMQDLYSQTVKFWSEEEKRAGYNKKEKNG